MLARYKQFGFAVSAWVFGLFWKIYSFLRAIVLISVDFWKI